MWRMVADSNNNTRVRPNGVYEDKFSWWRGGVGLKQLMFGGYRSTRAEQKPSIDVGTVDPHLTKLMSSHTSRIDRLSY